MPSRRQSRDVASLIFMNGDVHEHLVMFMNISEEIDVFMNIPATFMNIMFAKKVGRGPCRCLIFMNIRPSSARRPARAELLR